MLAVSYAYPASDRHPGRVYPAGDTRTEGGGIDAKVRIGSTGHARLVSDNHTASVFHVTKLPCWLHYPVIFRTENMPHLLKRK